MTNEEKKLLVAYLIDAGDIDPDGDVAVQFMDWYQVREDMVPGETHYKAILEAARVRAWSYTDGATVTPTTSPAWRSERS